MGRRNNLSALAKGLASIALLTSQEKIQLAHDAEGALRSGSEVDVAVELLSKLARDRDWLVRKAVAERLERLPDRSYAELAAVLLEDETFYVANAAKRSADRRQKDRRTATRRRVESLKVADGFARFAKARGAEVAAEARALGERWCEEAIKTIAHETLNNLTLVGLSLAQIEKRSTQDDLRCEASGAKACIVFLQQLMLNMQDYFAGLTVDRTREYLSSIAEEAVQRARSELQAALPTSADVPVDLSIPDSLSVSVSQSLFVACLKNLIKNGIEAVLDTSQPGRVRVRATVHDGIVRIEVQDEGTGIPDDKLHDIQRFVPGVTTKHSRGTGFGLPLVKRYIEQHDGELLIDSNVDSGTTVTLVLPQETE